MFGSSVVGGVIIEVRGIKLKGLYEFDDFGVVGSCGGSGVRGDSNGNRHRGLLFP